MLTFTKFNGVFEVKDLDTGKVIKFGSFKEAWHYLKIKEFVARVDGKLPTSRTQTVDSLFPGEAGCKKSVTYTVLAEVAL